MVKIKSFDEMWNMKVFTDDAEYFGEVEEAILTMTKVSSWKIKSTKSSLLNKTLGGAKGVIVPHNLVKAIGDIMLISKAAIPAYEEEQEEK